MVFVVIYDVLFKLIFVLGFCSAKEIREGVLQQIATYFKFYKIVFEMSFVVIAFLKSHRTFVFMQFLMCEIFFRQLSWWTPPRHSWTRRPYYSEHTPICKKFNKKHKNKCFRLFFINEKSEMVEKTFFVHNKFND